MRLMICCLSAGLTLAGCSKPAEAPAANDDAEVTTTAAPTAAPVAAELMETTWEFTDPNGKAVQESIDANGNFITTSGADHVDHGTVVMKDGKTCFTSAMTTEGEVCWSDPKVKEVGQSGETISDKGEKLTVKRVAYVAKTM